MTLVRTIIELPENQLEALDAICRRDGISRAEAIRRAVAAHVGRESLAARSSAYGLWRDRPVDGLALQESLRNEWTSVSPKPARISRRRRRA